MDIQKKPNWLLLSITLLVSFHSLLAFGEGFPLREKYPDVPIIEIDDLFQQYDNVMIIDVRSRLEFKTAQIRKAQHYALSNSSFVDYIGSVRQLNPEQKIILYCNGHSCAKSYIATEALISEDIDNVFAFDAGVFDWAVAHPEKTTLLGESPADVNKIISKAELESVLRDYSFLRTHSQKDDVMVIDIRDRFQVKFTPSFSHLKKIKLDALFPIFMQSKLKNKRLVFIDAVGRQVQWLQYYLEEFGYKDYLFLRGGVASIQ